MYIDNGCFDTEVSERVLGEKCREYEKCIHKNVIIYIILD